VVDGFHLTLGSTECTQPRKLSRPLCNCISLVNCSGRSEISHVAIHKWINRYVGLMKIYLEKITPNVADAWRADELYLKVKGNPKYLFALMDDQTRFWIAQQVADTKYTSNIRPLFAHAKEIAGKRPNTMITDGAPNFHEAFIKEFYILFTFEGCEHVYVITYRKDGNIWTNIPPLDFNREYLFHVRLHSDGFKELHQKRFKFNAKSWDDITFQEMK
jgi:hypothetical protein